MTAPLTQTGPDVQAQNDLAAQRMVTASQVTGGNRPQLATILAGSGITDSDMATIGGFAQAANLAVANRLAQDSGARTDFSTGAEQSALAAINEPTPNQPPPAPQGRNWLESAVDAFGNAVSGTGNFLFNNPVTHAVEAGLNWLGNAAHMPFRMLSAAVGGEDTQARDTEMQALGYDPSSEVSRLAFMFSHGDGEFHNLDSLRQSDPNGSQLVDLAVRMQTDPDGYQKWKQGLAADPNNQANLATLKQVTDTENSAQFQKISQAVDAQHISPGRDLAGLVFAPFGGKSEDNIGFKLLSGALDAAYTWFADPTLIGGKVLAGVRAADVLGRVADDAGMGARAMNAVAQTPVFAAMRAGLQSTVDAAGIRAALGLAEDGTQIATTRASQYWQGLIDTNAQWVQAAKTAADTTLSDAERAAAKVQEGQLFNQLNQKYKTVLPLLPELNGTRIVVPEGAVRWNEAGGLDHAETVAAAQTRLDAGQLPEDTYRAIVNGDTEILKNTRAGAKDLAVVKDLANAAPPSSLAEVADKLVSTNALMRLNGGIAAQQSILMPGRLSYAMMAKAAAANLATKTAGKFFDYTNPAKLLAHPAEQAGTDLLQQSLLAHAIGDTDAAAQAGRDAYATMKRGTPDSSPLAAAGIDATGRDDQGNILQIGRSGFDLAKWARAKTERVVRRLTSMQPGTTLLDLTDSNSVQQVRNYARLYMTKGDADRLASSYSMGSLAQRRQILAGITVQNMHASGVMQSTGGQAFADRFLNDQEGLLKRKYGYGASSTVKTEAGDRDVAILPSQLSDHVVIPSFRELQYAAGKFAVGGFLADHGFAGFKAGLLYSPTTDAIMHAIKLGWITTAASGLRNVIEESATAIAKGMGPRMLQGRVAWSAVTQQERQDLVDTSQKFQTWVKVYGREGAEQKRQEIIGRTLADGSASPEEIRQAQLLSRVIRYRIPLMFRRGIDAVNNKLIGQLGTDSVGNVVVSSILGKALSYNSKLAITPELLEHARELMQPELASLMKEGVHSAKVASGDLVGSAEAMDLHRAGFQARPYGFVGWRPDGYGQVEYDGGAGHDAFAKYLQQLVGDRVSPAHTWLQTYKQTGGDLAAATRAVRAYTDDPAMAHFVQNGEIFHTLNDGTKVAAKDPDALAALQSQAKDEYANRFTDNMIQALSKKGTAEGEADIAPKLLARLLKAPTLGAPDRQWLSTELADDDLPGHVIQQRWAPYNQAHEPGGFLKGYTQMLTKGYQKLSVDQINGLTRNPLMTGLYLQARQNLKPYEEHLLDAGWDSDIASQTAQRMALSHAQEEVFRHIDNPYVATQFATLARNLWAFERFQEDWLRRWGRTLRDNPEIIRKAQLLIHGGQSTGLVEDDGQGNLRFIYPGSALALNIFNKAFSAMGLGAQVQIPVTADLSSDLNLINASLHNPFGYSGTPLVSIPFHVMASTVGADHPILMSSLDKAINGDLGAGKSWWEQMLPSWANHIYSGVISQDPASKFGAAYSNVLFNAEAAGQLQGIDSVTDPATGQVVNGANASGIANFQRTLGIQLRNNLVLDALFGMVAPASPTLNEEVSPASKDYRGNTPDFSAHLQGLASLKAEAQALLKTMPYDQFKLYWQTTHPHELIYDQSGAGARTTVGSKGAYEPADMVAARWMQDNADFVRQYGGQGGLANYFLPAGQPGSAGGTFSDIAYRAELENGMRQYKPLEDVWKDIILQRGEDIYYRAKDAYDAGMATTDKWGQTELTRQQQQTWDTVRNAIYAGNPLLAEKFESAGANQDVRTTQVAQLGKMLADPSPMVQQAIGGLRPGIEALVQNWQVYQQQLAKIRDTRFYTTPHQTEQLNGEYRQALAAVAQNYPGLQGLINGVFRTPN